LTAFAGFSLAGQFMGIEGVAHFIGEIAKFSANANRDLIEYSECLVGMQTKFC
jgi:hypothetical protein